MPDYGRTSRASTYLEAKLEGGALRRRARRSSPLQKTSANPLGLPLSPSPHDELILIARFASETESQFLQDAVGSVFLRQRKRKNPGPGLCVLHNLNQMTRHFSSEPATLKFWKSEICDLDFAVPRRRTKCAGSNDNSVFNRQIADPRCE